MPNLKTLYDEDFVAWTKQQADALRATAQGRTNQLIDWENLAEEIEDLGRSLRHELRSQIRRIVLHLVKLSVSPSKEPRRGWRESIRDARNEVDDLLEENPSLKTELLQIISSETKKGAKQAIAALADFDELNLVQSQHLVGNEDVVSFSPDQILGDWFPPDPDRGPLAHGGEEP